MWLSSVGVSAGGLSISYKNIQVYNGIYKIYLYVKRVQFNFKIILEKVQVLLSNF